MILFLLLLPHPPISTLFPYTTLFRSIDHDVPVLAPPLCAVVDLLAVEQLGGIGRAVGNAPGKIDRRRAEQHISRSEEHTSELQSHVNLVCRLLLEKKKKR